MSQRQRDQDGKLSQSYPSLGAVLGRSPKTPRNNPQGRLHVIASFTMETQ